MNPFSASTRTRRLGTGLFVIFLSLFAALFVSLLADRASAQDQPAPSPTFDISRVTFPTSPPLAPLGRAIYAENCAPCHGAEGMGNGPAAADLPSPPTAFADSQAIWNLSPAQLFHTTKYGRMEKLMPPWGNRLNDDEIWQAVSFAWSLHTAQSQVDEGASYYAESCANCHGVGGAGDGAEATEGTPDFTDAAYIMTRSQADLLAGWQSAHADVGQEWSLEQQERTLEYVRTFSYTPPWESAYRAGTGVITGTVATGAGGGLDVAGLTVDLQAFMGFDAMAAFTTTTDSSGNFQFNDLSTESGIVYLAAVTIDGISFSSDLVTLTPEETAAQARIVVYNKTDDPTGVRLNRTHWIVDSQPGALIVAQILSFGSTSDRAFVGTRVEGIDEPVTVSLDVPIDAQEISFENGAVGDRFIQVGNRIYDTLPVLPGEATRQIIVRYALPYEGTSYTLKQEFYYPVDQLSLLVADLPELRIESSSLTFGSEETLQGQTYQLWRKDDLAPQTVEVNLSGLLDVAEIDPRATGETAGATSAASPAASLMDDWMPIAMAVLVAGALLVGLVWAIRRGTLRSGRSMRDLSQVRAQLAQQIAHLDDMHALGEIDAQTWEKQRAQAKAQLLSVALQISQHPAVRQRQ